MAIKAAVATLAVALLGGAALGGVGVASGQPPTATASATATVAIREFSFRPATLRVSPGTTVVFANRDSVRHTATRGGSFDTGPIRPGKSKSVRFGARGTYRFHCSIHPEMRGKIVVD
jgi:plastocyanin